jgi:hypothetical protein
VRRTKARADFSHLNAYSLGQFCTAHGLSYWAYCKLRAQGKAPQEMRLGTRILIGYRAAADWRQARETAA